jgi:hydroxypyruvate isomerase
MVGGMALAAAGGQIFAQEEKTAKPYKALFAPHPNQFPGGPKDYIDQLKMAHDLGFRAWEDNALGRQPAALQEKVGQFIRDKKMTLGVMVITMGDGMHFAKSTDAGLKKLEADMKHGVECSKRTGQTWMTMVPGIRVEGTPLAQQIEGSVDVLKRCCDIVEEHGIILVQEPLSHDIKGGAPLLRSFMDGFQLCELVNRKSCKLLADFYHQGQIGNELIPNAEKTWSQVAYVQYGDVPGRKEPGTGELDYVAVTKWLREKGYNGVIGMEHGVAGEKKKGQMESAEEMQQRLDNLVNAYRKIDA